MHREEKVRRIMPFEIVVLAIAVLIGLRFAWDMMVGGHEFEIAVGVLIVLTLLATAILWALAHIVSAVFKKMSSKLTKGESRV